MTNRSSRVFVVALVAAVVLTAADLGSKEWVLSALSSERSGDKPPLCERSPEGYVFPQRIRKPAIVISESYLELRYAENCGAAFGFLRQAPPLVRKSVFGLAAVVASIALFWLLAKGRGGKLFAWAVPLIVSGAVGNLTDRIRHGFVVDFIRAHWRDGPEWPTFNVADITITIGIALLVIDSFLKREPEPAAAQAQATPSTPAETASSPAPNEEAGS